MFFSGSLCSMMNSAWKTRRSQQLFCILMLFVFCRTKRIRL